MRPNRGAGVSARKGLTPPTSAVRGNEKMQLKTRSSSQMMSAFGRIPGKLSKALNGAIERLRHVEISAFDELPGIQQAVSATSRRMRLDGRGRWATVYKTAHSKQRASSRTALHLREIPADFSKVLRSPTQHLREPDLSIFDESRGICRRCALNNCGSTRRSMAGTI